MNLLYTIYKLCSYLFQLLAPWYLRRRLRAAKEIETRYQEKLGKYNLVRPEGKLVWIHVASVGEMNSIIPLVKKFEEVRADITFLITSVTVNSSKIFTKAGMKNAYHQFAPMDCPKFVKIFLDHWKPNLGIFIDSEIWPNLIVESTEMFPLLMLNGRLSDASYAKWSKIGLRGIARLLYNKFTKIMPTSKDDERKIGAFADKSRIHNIGNLKYAQSELALDKASLNEIEKMIGERPVWIAASTHAPEDEEIINCHLAIVKEIPNVLTVIAPRQTMNGPNLSALATKNNLKSVMRSKKEKVTKETAVYIADTIGELNLFYSASKVAFIGGSLFCHGGHNILEPARFSNAILSGVHTHNFRDIINDFKEADAIIEVTDWKGLATKVIWLLRTSKEVKGYGDRAKKLTERNSNVVMRAIEEISKFI